MDAPRIQYLKSSDGVSIAYWKLGEGGTPLLMAPPLGASHLSLEWEVPELRAWYERLASRRLLVRYDPRGLGMSERDVADCSLETHATDLACLAGQIGEGAFDLLAFGFIGLGAIKFAAREPERIRRLVLWNSLAGPYGPKTSERLDALLSLAELDWDLAVETFARTMIGWSRDQEASRWAVFLKASQKQGDFLRGWRQFRKGFDIRPLLPQVTAPTLILESEYTNAIPRSHARLLASGIPNAQLLHLGPKAPDENEEGTRAVEEFLSDGGPSVPATPVSQQVDTPSGMTAILFADIVDSTSLTETLGDTAFRAKARELDTSMRTIIREHAGTPIDGKLLGDGVLATFASASQAIAAALACGRAGEAGGLPLHLGLHAGDVIREEGNVFGGAVNVAARISGLSAPGEVLVSATVRDLARTSAGVSFEDRGEQALKGVGEAVRVFRVVVRETG
jgi:class 3 adenylate cyclase